MTNPNKYTASFVERLEKETNASDDPTLNTLKEVAKMLGKHFDAVQIFASKNLTEGENATLEGSAGTGNWFTRYGMVQAWIVQSEEHERIKVRKDLES